MVQLHDPESSRQLIRDRLISKKWWVLLLPGDIPPFLSTLEERCYSGERNADFEIMMGSIAGSGFCCVCMARKKWATPKKLSALLQESGCTITPESLRRRDILIFVEPGSDDDSIVSVFRWLGTRPGEPPISALVDGSEASNGQKDRF
jgi:hypothetical protein